MSPCGTLHCTVGLAATDPFFQAQGLTLETRSVSTGSELCFCVNGASYVGHGGVHMEKLFGENAGELFDQYGEGLELEYHDFPAGVDISGRVIEYSTGEVLTHKQLALMRLRYQLEKVTQ